MCRAWLMHSAPARLTLLLALTAELAGCQGELPAHQQARDGYRVDHRHASSAHNSRVHYLILHYTDEDQARSLEVLSGPHVSSHYLLPAEPEERHVFQLVDESRRAWHAGVSAWGERHHLNDTSLGIEIVNQGPALSAPELLKRLDAPTPPDLRWAPYSAAQVETLIALLRDLIERHDIEPVNVLAHSDVAPERKIDPGPAFPWQRLHDAGIGAWPDDEAVARYTRRFRQSPPDLATLQSALAAWGYAVTPSGQLDERTRAVLRAFQMHFRPADYRGYPDVDTAARLWALLEGYRPDALEALQQPSAAGQETD